MTSSAHPTPAGFICIDEPLNNSILQWLTWGALVILLEVILYGLHLPTSYLLALSILLLLCLVFSQLLPYHITAISTLPLSKNTAEKCLGDVEWQLGINQLELGNFFSPNQQSSEVWQVVLLQANEYHVAIVLKFWVMSPTEKKLSVIIWQNQVTPDTWRQLCVLAHI